MSARPRVPFSQSRPAAMDSRARRTTHSSRSRRARMSRATKEGGTGAVVAHRGDEAPHALLVAREKDLRRDGRAVRPHPRRVHHHEALHHLGVRPRQAADDPPAHGEARDAGPAEADRRHEAANGLDLHRDRVVGRRPAAPTRRSPAGPARRRGSAGRAGAISRPQSCVALLAETVHEKRGAAPTPPRGSGDGRGPPARAGCGPPRGAAAGLPTSRRPSPVARSRSPARPRSGRARRPSSNGEDSHVDGSSAPACHSEAPRGRVAGIRRAQNV